MAIYYCESTHVAPNKHTIMAPIHIVSTVNWVHHSRDIDSFHGKFNTRLLFSLLFKFSFIFKPCTVPGQVLGHPRYSVSGLKFLFTHFVCIFCTITEYTIPQATPMPTLGPWMSLRHEHRPIR
jgi:hypothetical protein